MERKRKTDDDIRAAVVGSITYAEILVKLGLVPRGGNYKTLKRRIRLLGIDTGHLKGKQWNKGGVGWPNMSKKSLESIMVLDSSYSTFTLKNRLFKAGIFKKVCNCCGRDSWLGKPMPLELEHKNGNCWDHRIENLEIICPNCHSFTDTYRGKNSVGNRIGRVERKCSHCGGKVSLQSKSGLCHLCCPKFSRKTGLERKAPKDVYCSQCGAKITIKSMSGMCSSCSRKKDRRVVRPDLNDLLKEVEDTSYLEVGRKYGVSDNAIRKWIAVGKKNVPVSQLAGGGGLKIPWV